MSDLNPINLAEPFLPKGVSEFFTITAVTQSIDEIKISLDENDIYPEEYKDDKLTSKGFFEPITVLDFPLRGKCVYMDIRRRRWINETIGTMVWRDWELVAKGTRMTKEFASFLKEISRYKASKQ